MHLMRMGGETMNYHSGIQMHGARPPFTPAQWQELEHQALIFKYMMAGIPVPPDLLIPIRKSLEAINAGLFHHSHHIHPNSKISTVAGYVSQSHFKDFLASI